MNVKMMIAGFLISMITLGSTAWSYTETPITNGGHITGTVTLQGEIPNP